MKCKDCNSCIKGFFKYLPDKYVCIGIKEPFVIDDIRKECTEYYQKDDEETPMVNKKSWEEFKNSGFLWWINMILHTFGWSIVTKIEDGKIIDVYPARVKFRGFDEKNNTEGYIKVSQYMKENADDLLQEVDA